jgi:putative tricarboxylic transport membrane protein
VATAVPYENRGGAAGTIGLAQFAKGYRSDPHALMVMGSVMLGGIITGRPPVGLDQVQPLGRLTNEFNAFVLPAHSPFKDMAEVLRQFRHDPGSIKWGGGSRGSTEHIAVHMIAKAMGVAPQRINYVPFRGGGEAAAALMAGYLTVGGSGFSEFLPHIAPPRMRAVAVTSSERLPGSDAPTLTELGVDVVIGNWRGLCAPADLTTTELGALTEAVQAALQSADWKASLQHHQWLPDPLMGAAFEAFVAQEFESLRDVLLKAGLG